MLNATEVDELHDQLQAWGAVRCPVPPVNLDVQVLQVRRTAYALASVAVTAADGGTVATPAGADADVHALLRRLARRAMVRLSLRGLERGSEVETARRMLGGLAADAAEVGLLLEAHRLDGRPVPVPTSMVHHGDRP